MNDKEIAEMGHRTVAEAVQDIPGFLYNEAFYHTGRGALVRGMLMSALVLHNTVDLYMSGSGALPYGENVPIEGIKRIEAISGPGGVLWGANSFLGVINMVSKTADDVDGVEASAGYGSGRGWPDTFRGNVLAGTKLWQDRVKIFALFNYHTWRHPEMWFPNKVLLRSTVPQPISPHFMTVEPAVSDAQRSHMLLLEGNVHAGPLSFYWHMPFFEQVRGASFAGASPVINNLGEDNIDCTDPANKNACLNRVDPLRGARRHSWNVYERYWMLRYRDNFFDNALSMEGRAYYINYRGIMIRYVSIPPSSILQEGVVVNQPSFGGDRVSLSLDGNLTLPSSMRLLFGGTTIYDWQSTTQANFLIGDATLDRLPFRPACPPDTADKKCPIPISLQSNRINLGLFVNWQMKLHKTLLLDAGARLTGATGKREVDPLALFSGTLVWSFLPDWHLKLNYSEGYRPPVLGKMDGNGEGINWPGNPYLEIERSRALQAEINTRLLSGHKTLRHLGFRADYSYSWVYDMIGTLAGGSKNLSDMGIHTVEALVDLQLKRGHWFGLVYTFVDSSDSFYGKQRSAPNQWATLRMLLNLFREQLFLSSNLQVIGSFEDFNRVPSQNAGQAFIGGVDANNEPVSVPVVKARASDLAMDRVRAHALWNAGLRYVLRKHGLRFDADFYNLLDVQTFNAEGWMELGASMNSVPNPRPGFAFFLKGQYSY
jgi:outer membrane receptor protein involved in Fe transport